MDHRRGDPSIEDSELCETTVLVSGSTEKAEHHGADRGIDYDAYHDGNAANDYDAIHIGTAERLPP